MWSIEWCHFYVTLSDLELLSKIFNDTKHRGASVTAELLVLNVLAAATRLVQ